MCKLARRIFGSEFALAEGRLIEEQLVALIFIRLKLNDYAKPLRVEADYLIETAIDPMAAEIMAGEQSSGTFRPVPGESAELKIRAAAQVEKLKMLEPVSEPSL